MEINIMNFFFIEIRWNPQKKQLLRTLLTGALNNILSSSIDGLHAYWSNEEWKESLDHQLDKIKNAAQTHCEKTSNYFFGKAVCEKI